MKKDWEKALASLSEKLGRSHDTEYQLELIVNEATRLVEAKAGYIRFLDGVPGAVNVATASAAGYLSEVSRVNPSVRAQEGVTAAGHVMATRQPLTLEDVTKSELILRETRVIAEKHGFHGMAALPVLSGERPLGVLFVFDRDVRWFTGDEVSLLTAFAQQASEAVEKAQPPI